MAAVVNHAYAKASGGQFRIRIDDTDINRPMVELDQLVGDLEWAGITSDVPIVRQSARAADHRARADELRADGAAVVRGGAVYFRMDPGEHVVADPARGTVRFPAGALRDFVIVRSDGRPTFTLACTVDDVDASITHVVRGEDHLTTSARQAALTRALGAAVPVFAHLPIVVAADGTKLGKRSGAASVASLRADGVPAGAVRTWLLELAGGLDLAQLSRGTVRADRARLRDLARDVIRALPDDVFVRHLQAFRADFAPAAVGRARPALEGVATFAEAADALAFLAQRPVGDEVDPTWVAAWLFAHAAEEPTAVVASLRDEARRRDERIPSALHAARLLLTGRERGIALDGVLRALGPDEIRARTMSGGGSQT